MKKLVLNICLVLAMAFTAKAQQTEPKSTLSKEEKAALKLAKEKEDHDLWVKAGLSENEIVQVKSISEEYAKKDSEVKKNDQLSAEDKSAKRKAISQEKRQKITALITEEKYKNYFKLRKEAGTATKESSN